MAIRFGLSPWGAIGGFAGGLAEGALAGSTIAAQQQRVQLAREQMEQTRLQNALGMLLKGAELEQVMPGMGVQIMQKAGELAPQLKLGGGEGGFPWSHEQALKARAQRAATEADILSSLDPTLAAHRGSLLAQLYGIKDPKLDKIDPVMGILAKLKLPRDPAQWTQQQGAQFLTEYLTYLTEKKGTEFQARMNFNVPMPGMGGHGGRGGGDFWKGKAWYIMPDGSKQFGDVGNPPPGYQGGGMMKISTRDPGEETTTPMGANEILAATKIFEMMKDPTLMKDPAFAGFAKGALQQLQFPKLVNVGPGDQPLMRPPKQKSRKGQAAPPPWQPQPGGGTDAPPPSGQ